jgi:hypothetical protein
LKYKIGFLKYIYCKELPRSGPLEGRNSALSGILPIS